MIKKLYLLMWLSCLCWNYSIAQVSGVTPLMVQDARQNLEKSMTAVRGGESRVKVIYDSAFEKAAACPSAECAYASYVNGIYDLVEYLGARRKCPISLKDLSGEWVNSSGWGHYEKIALSLYKGKPSVHQFIVFKPLKVGDLEDGFGGWRFGACKVKTLERTSSGGRIFNPGNELIVLSYDRLARALVVLDGDYVVRYVR